MKLIPVTYYGFTAMDRRFSSPMLPWIVSEIRKRDYCEKLSLGIEDGLLQAYNPDFELQFSHKIWQVTRFSQADQDPTTFLYLMRDDQDSLLYCYLFQAKKTSDVSELYKQMKDQNQAPTRSVSSAANLTSLCVDISPSSSNFFEVLYIGKIKVWQKKVPDTFIDDALEKFKTHEMEKIKAKMLGNIGRLRSEDNIRRGSNSSTSSVESYGHPHLQRSQSSMSGLTVKTVEDKDEDKEDDSKSVDMDDHNRTMVLQVDRTDLRLISPDRKVILLHKQHKDITTCIQGVQKMEHFGFVCREGKNGQTFVGYIFKCESSSIATDAVSAITQAFASSESRPRPAITSCDHCPMVWFHKLCTEIERMSDRKTQAAILRRLEELDLEEQNTILAKFKGAETDSVREQNEFLMMLLRAHCEMKQGRHVHDTAENRSEFLNQYLGGGGTIFMKAKRSLTNSFEMLKRKASKDDFGASLREMNRENSPHSPTIEVSDKDSEGMRSRSSTIGSQSDLHLMVQETKSSVSPDRSVTTPDRTPKSPMMDIFLKVGSSPKSVTSEDGSPKIDSGSWRQAIFKRVITPSKNDKPVEMKQRTKEELRELWKKSIYQAILLVRMEKENARLKAEQEESAVKRIKLEYDEMKPPQREVMEVWEMLTNKEARMKCDNQMLLQAIRQGVPRGKRGEVWQFLAEQYCMRTAPIDTSNFPNYNVPYEQLLKQLTSHQHAILIDLGRTFPNHSYFSSPLGPGQLALFNLLKAYSLLDSEMGYCQGMSFVAGVLLLHMEESQAFFLLRHLMFRRGLRLQYLPDMVGLQVKLYQLSRLLHDQLPDLYNHFDFYEVAPTLYAAPWLLTIFASQFPLGFVTRVFDLIFLESPDVIFRVAIALLTFHKDNLLACDSFEEIMNYLKNKLPTIDKPTLDKIMKQVYTTDISKQLNEYKVEYQVLQEEMTSVQPQVEALHKLESQNKTLTEQNKALMAQLELALSNVQRLEKTRTLQQAQLNKLEMHSRALDVTIATLGNFLNTLIEQKVEIEIPDDVRRILNQISYSEKRKSELKPQNNLMKMFQKSENDKALVKSLSTGKIMLPVTLDQNILRSNSLEKSPQKTSQFFSSSHNHILQQFNNNNKIDIKVQECDLNKSISLPLDSYHEKVSPCNSVDSGVGTPSSPKPGDHHPLSNCDVNFTFHGTRELKNIKSIRNMSRNSSPDIIGK
ncbi:TBC1 domain family member 1 isoform X1 [Tribolium castaneum]|uniref:TBC1 domain family member 1 isoform X1 n=1 Tax=Tribolium castaneum TaxID=7070 RepID=UPI00077DB39D|nr:PREDICTED: TBC1 domain family member 1 isoform X1 [Tribolium castaneum]|eukprot:XP_015836514.1 PREDICTED: TBC1 domain family member 1 isoform X1 [Tribolium castaneum]